MHVRVGVGGAGTVPEAFVHREQDMDVNGIARMRRDRPPVVLLGDIKLVRPLGMASIPVILGTCDPDDVALRSRYVVGHCLLPGFGPGERERTVTILLDLGAKILSVLGCRVPLIYGSDAHLEVLYRFRTELSEYYQFLLNEEELGWSLHDKERFSRLCEQKGVLVPKTLRSGVDLVSGLRELRPPLVVKPRRKVAWCEIRDRLFEGKGKARVFATAEALLVHPAFEALRDELVVQEYIAGEVTQLYSFHGFADEHGRLLGWFSGRKLRTYPSVAGESCFIELVDHPAIEVTGRDVVARLGIRGPFKIDFVEDPRTGRLYTLEVNARYNLWHHLGAVHGVNLPGIAYDYFVHGRVCTNVRVRRPRYRWSSFYLDYQAYRERARRGDKCSMEWFVSVVSPWTVHETFAWQDPWPFVHWVVDHFRRRYGRRRLRAAMDVGAAPC